MLSILAPRDDGRRRCDNVVTMSMTSRERALTRLAVPGVRLLLVLACVASALTVVLLGTRLTFFNDDWYFLLQRPGLESHGGIDTLLAPHNGNLVLLLALLYEALVALFGLGSQLPYRVVMALTMVCIGALVYALVSRRVGAPLGLAATCVVLFLGAAWEDLLFFGALEDLGSSLAAGLAALLAMEVDSARRNRIACALLVCATLFSNAGLPFVVGAAVAIAIRRKPAQLWIAGVPAALFALWWALYGSSGPRYVTLHNIEHVPRYVLDSVSISLASATGLNHGAGALGRGHVLVASAALALLVGLARGWRPPAWSLVFGSTALAFWVLTGASFIPGREPVASRYQLIGGALLIVLAAELLRRVRFSRIAVAIILAGAVYAVASNVVALRGGFHFLREQSAYVKSDLGALELAGAKAAPGLWLIEPVARNPYLSGVTASRYFAAVAAHGVPPVYSPAQLERVPATQRQAADSVLASAYGIGLSPTAGGGTRSACVHVRAGARKPGTDIALGPGPVSIKSLGPAPVVVAVDRLAPGDYPVYVGFLAPRATVRLQTPRDSLSIPWRVSLMQPSQGTLTAADVCPG
jgi:hypothetical protein